MDLLPAKDLAALGVAIQREGKRKLSTKDDPYKAWRRVKPVSSLFDLDVAGTTVDVAPSKGGVVMLGNVQEPAAAVKLALGGGENRGVKLYVNPARAWLHGLQLSDQPAVRWRVGGKLKSGAKWRNSSGTADHARVAFWTPGAERTAAQFQKGCSKHYWDHERGVVALMVAASKPLAWLVGYDAADQPAVVLVGAPEVAALFETAPLGDVAAIAKTARADRAAKAAEDAGPPVAPATAAERTGIAAAIAAGPPKKAKVSKRFSLAWDKTPIASVKGKLKLGDPSGASFAIAAGTDGPKPTFRFYDEQDDSEGWVLGVRLGAGKVATWKPGKSIGVDSGCYGVWSPGFAVDDLEEGTHTAKPLAATIVRAADGDGVFGSLVGLDAAKRPVAILFGDGLRPDVFAS